MSKQPNYLVGWFGVHYEGGFWGEVMSEVCPGVFAIEPYMDDARETELWLFSLEAMMNWQFFCVEEDARESLREWEELISPNRH